MMFQALFPLLQQGQVTLVLNANADGTITAMVSQKAEGALATPLTLTATPDELDADFATVVGTFGQQRKSLAEQLEATNAILQAAEKASANKATKALSNPGKASTLVDKASGEADDDLVGDDNDEGDVAKSNQAPAAAVAEDNLFALASE